MPPSDRSQLLKLARTGAEARLAELQTEMDFIYRSFPDLSRKGATAPRTSQTPQPTRRRAGVRRWTAAQRKTAAERMKKYWAARKAGKK